MFVRTDDMCIGFIRTDTMNSVNASPNTCDIRFI